MLCSIALNKLLLSLVDNRLSTKLAKNPVCHKGSRHIEICFHFIREKVEKGEMESEFVRTLATADE